MHFLKEGNYVKINFHWCILVHLRVVAWLWLCGWLCRQSGWLSETETQLYCGDAIKVVLVCSWEVGCAIWKSITDISPPSLLHHLWKVNIFPPNTFLGLTKRKRSLMWGCYRYLGKPGTEKSQHLRGLLLGKPHQWVLSGEGDQTKLLLGESQDRVSPEWSVIRESDKMLIYFTHGSKEWPTCIFIFERLR